MNNHERLSKLEQILSDFRMLSQDGITTHGSLKTGYAVDHVQGARGVDGFPTPVYPPTPVVPPPVCPSLIGRNCDTYFEGWGDVNGNGLGFLPVNPNDFIGGTPGPDDCCPFLHYESSSDWDGTNCNCPDLPSFSSGSPHSGTWMTEVQIALGGSHTGEPCHTGDDSQCPFDLCIYTDCVTIVDPVTGIPDTDCTGDEDCVFCGCDGSTTFSSSGATYDVKPYDGTFGSCGGALAWKALDYPFCSTNNGSTHYGKAKFRHHLDGPLGDATARISWTETFYAQLTTCENCSLCPEVDDVGVETEVCYTLTQDDLIDAGDGTWYWIYEMDYPAGYGYNQITSFTTLECDGGCE